MQNGFIQRLNRTFGEDVLDAYWFENLEQLGIIAEKWRYNYNFYHPHKTLQYKASCQYASRYSKDLDPWKEEENEKFVKFIPVWKRGSLQNDYFTIPEEHEVDNSIAEALGCSSITLYPGLYKVQYNNNKAHTVLLNADIE